MWQINQGVVSDDVFDLFLYCKNVGEMFNLKDIKDENCNQIMYGNCFIGDFIFKYGKVFVFVVIEK